LAPPIGLETICEFPNLFLYNFLISTYTAGIGMIIEKESSMNDDVVPKVLNQLNAVFERDWKSNYAFPLTLGKNNLL
jgi:hypothetical protein